MKDDYLWDRSGKADPEIQRLEEILGALRHQPQPLRIRPGLRVGRRGLFFPVLAIAAAIALVAVGLALWLNFSRQQSVLPREAKRENVVTPQKSPPASPDSSGERAARDKATPPQKRHRESRNLLASYKPRHTQIRIRQPELTPQELAEKEQVVLALRLVSAKLSFAQRKVQGGPALNVIRNQHRIG